MRETLFSVARDRGPRPSSARLRPDASFLHESDGRIDEGDHRHYSPSRRPHGRAPSGRQSREISRPSSSAMISRPQSRAEGSPARPKLMPWRSLHALRGTDDRLEGVKNSARAARALQVHQTLQDLVAPHVWSATPTKPALARVSASGDDTRVRRRDKHPVGTTRRPPREGLSPRADR